MSPTETEELFHQVRDGIDVDPVDVPAVVASGRRFRTRRRVFTGASATALVAVLVAGLALLRPATHEPPITRGPYAGSTPWVSDGSLHLGTIAVKVGDARSLSQVADGAVVVTEDYDVVWVHADGTIDPLSQGAPYRVVSDPSSGWVSWVEGSLDQQPELVVYDTTKPGVVDRLSLTYKGPRWQFLDAGDFPISIDNGVVYYTAQDGDYRWDVEAGFGPVKVSEAGMVMLDHEADVDLFRPWSPDDGFGAVTINRRGAVPIRLGIDWRVSLSPGGRYALVWREASGVGPGYMHGSGYVRVYDTRTGELIDSGLSDGYYIDAAAFDLDGNVIVSATNDPPNPPASTVNSDLAPQPYGVPGPFDIISCNIAEATCTTIGQDIAPDSVTFPDP